MATEITKTYSVQIKFTYNDGATITEDDLNVSLLRALIKKSILEQCSVQKGILNANPVGDVTET